MQCKLVPRFLIIGVALLIIGASLMALLATTLLAHAASMNTRVALNGQTMPLLAQSSYVGAAQPQRQVQLSVALQPRNQTQLDALLQQMYTPGSSLYHRYLSSAQFNSLFAPTTQQVQRVASFLRSNGLQVTNVASNKLLLDVKGSVAQAQSAFHVRINNYRQGGFAFYANASAPSIPRPLSGVVSAVDGLDNSMTYHPLLQRLTKQHTHNANTPNGYGPSDLLGAYDIARLHQMGMLGDNQTIALFELDGYQQSDVMHYLQYYNPNASTPKLNNMLVDGFNGAAGMSAVEDELDIELLSAVAPHANMLVYEGPNSTQGINDIYNRIVNDNRAKIVSVSWGLCEAANGNAELQTLDNIFKQGAAEGISFFAASGDSGAYDCRDTNLWVDSPASDPYVTAVGGTQLQVNNGTYGGESAWADSGNKIHGPEGAGGGGGLSKTFRQAAWQNGPNVQNQYSNGFRQVPDVSAFASFAPGYAVYCTVTNAGCPSTGWVNIGGTSGAAPLWAGSMALVNQYVTARGGQPLGLANPTLYNLFRSNQIFPAFHDVNGGNNLYYPATNGYDLATGMGSPDVYNMALDLAPTNSQVPPAAPPAPTPPASGTVIAQDTFQRSDQSQWGNATDGQTWGGDANTLNVFSIVNGQGQVANGYTSYSAVLGPSTANAEVLLTGSLSFFGWSTTNIGAILRWSDPNNWYKAYIDGSNLIIQKRVNGNFNTIAATPFTPSANSLYSIRFRVVGNTLYAKAWLASNPEPANWMLTVNDGSLSSGTCGMRILVQGGAVATITSFQAMAV